LSSIIRLNEMTIFSFSVPSAVYVFLVFYLEKCIIGGRLITNKSYWCSILDT